MHTVISLYIYIYIYTYASLPAYKTISDLSIHEMHTTIATTTITTTTADIMATILPIILGPYNHNNVCILKTCIKDTMHL